MPVVNSSYGHGFILPPPQAMRIPTHRQYRPRQRREEPRRQPRSQGSDSKSGDSRHLKVASSTNPKKTGGCIAHTLRESQDQKDEPLPTLLATGASSVNQAVKAVAIARTYVQEEQLDVSCRPDFCNPTGGALSLLLKWATASAPTPQAVYSGGKVVEPTRSRDRSRRRRSRSSSSSNSRSRSRRRRSKSASPRKSSRSRSPQKTEEKSGIKSELRVAQQSEPSVLAGAIAKKVRVKETVMLLCIGPASVCQAVRAVIFANRYLQDDNLSVTFQPEFIHINDGGTGSNPTRSGVRFTLLIHEDASAKKAKPPKEADEARNGDQDTHNDDAMGSDHASDDEGA